MKPIFLDNVTFFANVSGSITFGRQGEKGISKRYIQIKFFIKYSFSFLRWQRERKKYFLKAKKTVTDTKAMEK